jgi:RNA polymerase sigma-70 factor, ECF subfamily
VRVWRALWPFPLAAVSVLGDVSSSNDAAWALRPAAAHRERHSARSDRALIRAAQRGDANALEQLFRAHWAMAQRTAYLVVHDATAAEDIAQEAFLSAVRALERFDRRRPFAPWLHRIVVNRAIDRARARALRREVVLGEVDAGTAPPPGSLDGIVPALATLPAEQRAVVVMRHLLEYTPGEIAELLEMPRGTVNSRLRRGLDALGRALEADS